MHVAFTCTVENLIYYNLGFVVCIDQIKYEMALC